ncbi:putative E3 ubiquitin-protein ligase MID2 [Saccoglossus kowalevskii]
MAAKIEDALQRELSCPICFELYSSPLLLPCGHTFCKDCLADTLEKHKQEGTANDDKGATAGTVVVDRSKLPCPTCRGEVDLQRQGLDSLRRNFLLDSIIEKYKAACARDGKEVKHKEEIILCDVCEKDPCKAVKSCTVCKISYCKKCLPVLHPSRGGLATHRMVRATSSSTPGVITCPSHEGELLKMYCTSCRTPVCYLCDRFGGHQGHQVSELKTVFGQEKDFLENEAKKLSGKNDGLQDFVKKIVGIINKIDVNDFMIFL